MGRAEQLKIPQCPGKCVAADLYSPWHSRVWQQQSSSLSLGRTKSPWGWSHVQRGSTEESANQPLVLPSPPGVTASRWVNKLIYEVSEGKMLSLLGTTHSFIDSCDKGGLDWSLITAFYPIA